MGVADSHVLQSMASTHDSDSPGKEDLGSVGRHCRRSIRSVVDPVLVRFKVVVFINVENQIFPDEEQSLATRSMPVFSGRVRTIPLRH